MLQDKEILRDIVDTTQYMMGSLDADRETVVKILLGGIYRRIDMEGVASQLYH